jgi:hypothetical protein
MDFLGDDLLINIAKRVVEHSMYDLFYFQRTNKRLAALSKDPIVTKSFGNDCIPLLTDLEPSHEKLDFMECLWAHGNPMFFLLRCSQQMLHETPNLGTIDRLLKNAAPFKSAEYFQLLLRALGPPPLDYEGVLKDFRELLMTRIMESYRLGILGGNTPFRFRCTWYRRAIPAGLIRHQFCNNWLNCPGDGRAGYYRGFLPAADEDYSFHNFCIDCRLDSEVRWFIEVFGMNHQR